MATNRPAPLAGKRIVVTRAPEQAGELIIQLRELGAEVLHLPAVTFSDPSDPAPLDKAVTSLRSFHWVLFTSQNALAFFVKRCKLLGANLQGDGRTSGVAHPVPPMIAAVGPATAEAARKEGLRVDFVASQYRGAALAEELGARLAGRRVLLPRSDRAGAELTAALRAQGAEVVDVVAYHTGTPESFDRNIAEAIARGEVDVVTFLSPSAFHHVVEAVGLETLRGVTDRVALAAIGPVTAAAIRQAGLRVEIEAKESTTSALVSAITDHFAQRLSPGVKSS